MPIGNHEIRRIAGLARIKLNPQDIAKYSQELALIVDYFNQLKDVDTQHITGTCHTKDQVAPLRKDHITASLTKKDALMNAPHTDGRFFLVPKVLEK